ncbi:glycosyltransferase family 2 protein [Pseudomonas frederiksbergensis]|uniref:glycosyltransferase family 2 protein n=1 Tax=Pseudomonas frederiksbergensis TaxID=104087 RepID=UPI00197F12D6|nr:glycosyltransferase family 2 protein [Pseudomonas frederiksbergensis]MBN3865710.1 glycosyltransferase family 2 protein [Pseudomonas frederiksbergensis]
MIELIEALIAIVLLSTIFMTYRTHRGASFILQEPKSINTNEHPYTFNLKTLVIIPVLREQQVIGNTLLHFEEILAHNTDAAIAVCGAAEETYSHDQESNTSLSTKETVIKVANEINNRQKRRFVTYLEYPYQNGIMAHQVNWAARYAFDAFDSPVDPTQTIVAIYNADSRPDSKSFLAMDAVFKTQGSAAQQISFYSSGQCNSNFYKWISNSAAVWQTRWALAVEVFRLRLSNKLNLHTDQTKNWHSELTRFLLHPYNYTIGHGFAVKLSTFIEMNYYPQTVRNEDAALGFVYSVSKLTVAPVVTHDNTEVPDSLKQLIKQQVSWYGGPAEALKYHSLTQRLFEQTSSSRRFSKLLTIKALYDAFIWITGPTIFALAIIGSFTGWPVCPTLAASIMLYLILPSLPLLLIRRSESWMSRKEILAGLATLPVFYLLHGFAAYLWICREVHGYVIGKKPTKFKTERSIVKP